MPTNEQALKHLLYPASSRPEIKDRIAATHAGADGSERKVSYEQLEQLIDCGCRALQEAGVKRLDRVLVTSTNTAELLAAILAAWKIGAQAVPVDVRMTTSEIANVARRLECKVLFGSPKSIENFPACFADLGDGIKVLDLSTLTGTPGTASGASAALDLKQDAFVILTSGTTGIPKGAVHDLETTMVNIIELSNLVDMNKDVRALLPLPLSHIFGLEVALCVVLHGAQLIFSEPSPKVLLACIGKYKPQIIAGVPTLYSAFLSAPKEAVDLSQAKVLLCGGAPLPPSLAVDFEEKFGKRINNGYGSTESKIIALNLDGPMESVGTIVPSVKVEIVNDKDEVLAAGETGEIRIAGPILMKGYLEQEEATKKVLHNGHYHTGDMGHFQGGYLFISGRTKEMIVVAGNKVFPTEVEDVLRTHPQAKEVAVIGVPHKQLGQIVKAVVVVKEGDLSDKLQGTPEEIKEARGDLISQMKEICKSSLKRELRPMDWDFFPATKPLPKTLSGKVDKKLLETAKV